MAKHKAQDKAQDTQAQAKGIIGRQKLELVKALIKRAVEQQADSPYINASGRPQARIPLHSWYFDGQSNYRFILRDVIDVCGSRGIPVDVGIITKAVVELTQDVTSGIKIDTDRIPAERAALQNLLDEAYNSRVREANAPIATQAKAYLRRFDVPKPTSKGKGKRTYQAPNWAAQFDDVLNAVLTQDAQDTQDGQDGQQDGQQDA